MEVDLSKTVADLKEQLQERTKVPAGKQKIMGLRSANPPNEVKLSEVGLAAGKTLMMIGSAEESAGIPTVQKAVTEESETGGFAASAPTSNGLTNIANTCYLNAAVQMIRSIPQIKEVLSSYTGNNVFIAQLGSVLRDLDSTKDAVVPLQLWTALIQAHPAFGERDDHGGFMQHDSQEVLNLMLQELKPALPAKYTHLFEGAVHQRLTCTDDPEDTGKESDTSFTMMSCNINGEVQTLEAGLECAFNETFTAPSEKLQRDAKFTRHSELSGLPEFLFVHMVRFSWRGDINKKAKILKPITFPIILDTTLVSNEKLKIEQKPVREEVKVRRDKVLESRRRPRTEVDAKPEDPAPVETVPLTLRNESGYYELCGVISHKGRSADGGHYVYWGKKGSTWLIYDDANVAAVSEEDVKRLRGVGEAHIAYVLLYRSRDPVTNVPTIPL